MLVVVYLLPGHWELLTTLMVFASLLSTAKSMHQLYLHRKSDKKLKQIFNIDSGIRFCYMICALGATAYFYFPQFPVQPLFVLPYIAFGVYILFQNHGANDYTGSKVFTVVEALQFFMISLKMNNYIQIHWNYTMLYFMLASIYMLVLGSILSIIMMCSFVGVMYQNLEAWKRNHFFFMTNS